MRILKIYENLGSDIYNNLAIEEYLMTTVKEGSFVLFLWSNSSTVVIGRNQNQHKECNLEKMAQDNVFLARRKTGGGAVFHDLGNLNFSYICTETDDSMEILNLLLQYLNSIHVPVTLSGRNDIVTTDSQRKVSGVAAMQSGRICLTHGTLLVNVNLQKMEQYLAVSPKKLKGIPSVRSRVVNIKEYNPKFTVEAVKNDFLHWLREYAPFSCTPCPLPSDACYKKIRTQYQSYDWNHTPPFSYDYKLQRNYSWGEIELYMKIQKETISDLHIYTDSLDYELIYAIKNTCRGMKLCNLEETFASIRQSFLTRPVFLWSPEKLDEILSDIRHMFL